MLFCAPKRFNGESTPFDMGYEQCKRDLKNLITKQLPDAVAIDGEFIEEVVPESKPYKHPWFPFR